MNAIREKKWETLKPETRKKIVQLAMLLLFVVVGTLYFYGKENQTVNNQVTEQYQALEVDGKLFEDDLNQTLTKSRSEALQRDNVQNEKIAEQSKKLEEQKNEMEALKALLAGFEARATEDDTSLSEPTVNYPPSPFPNNMANVNADQLQPTIEQESPALIGGIEHIKIEKPLITENKNKKGRKIYLPPSFMQATLLTGMDASTTEGANEHPQPLMIRVQEPAVLPNAIKTDLQGCFVVAHGFGALNKERIETRLVSLNCLSKNGNAIIDTAVKGYVTDNSDGKSGLKGLVVSKQGAHLARVFAAGVFGGIGKVAEQKGQTVTVGPVTTTTSLNPGDAITAGIGSGIADSSKDLRKFFLDLAKQASPVISVGPAKKLTVVITEGVWLDIRENKDA